MRRSEREIKGRTELFEVLSQCQVIRLALFDEKYPYIVPLSFGIEQENENISVYFHCANEGKKTALLKKNNRVCVEADAFVGNFGEGMNATTLYKSVIGFGKCEKCEGGEKLRGLELLLSHCGREPDRAMLSKCAALEKTAVYKITFDELTGKKNIK